MSSIGPFLAIIRVCIGVMVLRKKHPEIKRGFKTPWVPVVPILGILTCLLMMVSLPADTWIWLFVWLAIGLVICLTYGKKNSMLR